MPQSSRPSRIEPQGHELDEPFGQAGVRRFAPRIIAWICVIIASSSVAMGHRSTMFRDNLLWKSPDATMSIDSVAGRIFIRGSGQGGGNAGSGWSYRSNFIRGTQDRWMPSLWKVIGIEFSSEPMRGDPSGFWLRIKWSFIAMLFAIQPIWRVIVAFTRWRHYRS